MLGNGAVKDVIANKNGSVKGVLFGMIGSCAFILASQLVWIVAVIFKDLNDPERLAKRAENIKKRTMARKQLNAAKIAARTAEKQMELDRQRADTPTRVNKVDTKGLERRVAQLNQQTEQLKAEALKKKKAKTDTGDTEQQGETKSE